ncbi:MAG: twin-arginine translocase TatA/TatE family subunit, partial [Candidatus Poribacteria bacterium]
ILLIVLIIFGPSKLPQMGQALGKAIREFKKAGRELKSEATDLDDEDEEENKRKPNKTATSTKGDKEKS